MSLVTPKARRVAATVILGLTVALAGWSALATPGASDRDVAQQMLASLPAAASASAGASPTAHARQEALRALRRADDARRAGDQKNAALLEGLAREWAELARDTSTAVELESRADTLQRKSASETQTLRRERALLDELTARRSRAEGELAELRSASSVHSAAIDAARARAPGSAAPAGSSRPVSSPPSTSAPPPPSSARPARASGGAQ